MIQRMITIEYAFLLLHLNYTGKDETKYVYTSSSKASPENKKIQVESTTKKKSVAMLWKNNVRIVVGQIFCVCLVALK